MDRYELNSLVDRHISGQQRKLGYPDSLLLYCERESESGFNIKYSSMSNRIIDQQKLGIKEHSLFDTGLINVGDIFEKDPINRHLHGNEYERRVVKIIGDYLGIDNVRGYVNSSPEESNFISYYWNRNYLQMKRFIQIQKMKKESESQKQQLKQEENRNGNQKNYQKMVEIQKSIDSNEQKRMNYEKVYLISCQNNTRQSVYKQCDKLGLEMIEIQSDCNGMELRDLERQLNRLIEQEQPLNIIMNLQTGSSEYGTMDQISSIHKILTKKQNEYDLIFSVHLDGGYYGMTIPLLEDEEYRDIQKYVNTFGMSLNDLIGIGPSPHSVVLTTSDHLNECYDQNACLVEYIGNAMDITFGGCRSGTMMIAIYHHLLSLGLPNKQKIRQFYQASLNKANYMYSQLQTVFHNSQIKYNSIFHFGFPINDQHIIKKYQLLSHNDTNNVSTIIQATHSQQLIDEFIYEVRKSMEINRKNNDSSPVTIDQSNSESRCYNKMNTDCQFVKYKITLQHGDSTSTNGSLRLEIPILDILKKKIKI